MKITETPRDGWQGIKKYIPVEQKAKYINNLLKVGFDVIEVGSFVSSRALPQLADTGALIEMLDISETDTKTMVLVVTKKGGELASDYDQINYLSYPYSISETFLKKNQNTDKDKAKITLNELNDICLKCRKELLVYITMGFGNPYGDSWNMELLYEAVELLDNMNINKVLLTDIVGLSTPGIISEVYSLLTIEFPHIEFGLHLHTTKETYYEKVKAAYRNGCKRFDTVLTGLGGCPFTGKELLSNLDTFDFIDFLKQSGTKHNLNEEQLNLSSEILLDVIRI